MDSSNLIYLLPLLDHKQTVAIENPIPRKVHTTNCCNIQLFRHPHKTNPQLLQPTILSFTFHWTATTFSWWVFFFVFLLSLSLFFMIWCQELYINEMKYFSLGNYLVSTFLWILISELYNIFLLLFISRHTRTLFFRECSSRRTRTHTRTPHKAHPSSRDESLP